MDMRREIYFFFKQKTAYEILAVTGVQTCALPISSVTTHSWTTAASRRPSARTAPSVSGRRSSSARRLSTAGTPKRRAQNGRGLCRGKGGVVLGVRCIKKKNNKRKQR